ncbi:uncharacterized protein LOC9645257 isoform X4 [Selaginella moellendorffii]|uniref:uncharacterized protein LOC9645257 isoform X4 n=1 Tax=Selaginella moellendorffii TaxID=88036 RepID=UPI000D1C4F7F|nr:uncharacterized protein LOC9645257 isoform X4 [Selaginella moellendorffii]|eukprot:XP_024536341.1 uncharacterized protein LOC9645257 isoform X4 [Selaginella moellendorffii]
MLKWIVSSERWDMDAKDAALDALGQLLLLRCVRPPHYVVHSAYESELAAVHALVALLDEQAENVLRDPIKRSCVKPLVRDHQLNFRKTFTSKNAGV